MAEHTPAQERVLKQYAMKGSCHDWKDEDKWELLKTIAEDMDVPPRALSLLNTKQKEVVYCPRGGAALIAKKHKLSVALTEKLIKDGIAVYSARCSDMEGRFTDATGVISLNGLTGSDMANKLMHVETKATRRAILNHVGLGILDDSETESMPGAKEVQVSAPEPVPTTVSKKTDPKPEAAAPTPAAVAAPVAPQAAPAAPAAVVAATTVPETAAPTDELARFGGPADDALCGPEGVSLIIKAGGVAGLQPIDVAKYLKATHGVTNSNKAETLTGKIFRLSMLAMEQARLVKGGAA